MLDFPCTAETFTEGKVTCDARASPDLTLFLFVRSYLIVIIIIIIIVVIIIIITITSTTTTTVLSIENETSPKNKLDWIGFISCWFHFQHFFQKGNAGRIGKVRVERLDGRTVASLLTLRTDHCLLHTAY